MLGVNFSLATIPYLLKVLLGGFMVMTGKDKKVRGEEFKIDTTCTLASKKRL